MKKSVVVLAVLMLMGAGCSFGTAPVQPEQDTSAEDVRASLNGTWQLETFASADAQARDVSEIGATLTIGADGQLGAVICNSMSGAYAIETGMLKVSTLVSTKMFCEGLRGEIETAFSRGISAGLGIETSDATLILRSSAGPIFTYERGEPTRVGAPDEEPAGENHVVNGTVVSVDTDQVPVDGPAVVNVRTSSGSIIKVLVPSFGLGLCKAKASIADVYALKAGDVVEASGSAGVDGAIVPCQSEMHYLRVVKK